MVAAGQTDSYVERYLAEGSADSSGNVPEELHTDQHWLHAADR